LPQPEQRRKNVCLRIGTKTKRYTVKITKLILIAISVDLVQKILSRHYYGFGASILVATPMPAIAAFFSAVLLSQEVDNDDDDAPSPFVSTGLE
jgi:hypothetical protein